MLGESPQFKAMTGKYHSSAKLQATNLFFSVNSKIYNVFSTNLLGLSHMFAVHRIFETDRFNTQFLNSASNRFSIVSALANTRKLFANQHVHNAKRSETGTDRYAR